MNKELFDVLVQTEQNIKENLDYNGKRFLDRLILERKLDGLHLDEETRTKTKNLKEKISDLCLEYSKNCNEEATKLHFTAEQLSNIILL